MQFNAAEYERESTEGSVFFDYEDEQMAQGSWGGSNPSGSSSGPSSTNRSWWSNSSTNVSHNQDIPRYIHPHARDVNLDMGDFVVTKEHNGKPDLMGNDNDKYRKLYHPVPYSLPTPVIGVLTKLFPSLFFASRDHVNHSHPVSHTCSTVAWRFACRKFNPGEKILDVYGNPTAAAAFNHSQARARNPKIMRCLVDLMCPNDFLRLVHKYGPWQAGDPDRREPSYDVNTGNYDIGTIENAPMDYLRQFDCFNFHHTAYYIRPSLLWKIFQANPRAKVSIQLLRHVGEGGSLNNGEMKYVVKGGIVKHECAKSGSVYYHPNISDFWFRPSKQWIMPGHDSGFVWECQEDCQDNWSITVCHFDPRNINAQAVDWERQFMAEEIKEAKDKFVPGARERPNNTLMTEDGKVLILDIVSWELVEDLRGMCAGKNRKGTKGRELLMRMIDTARLLVKPSSMLPGAKGLCVPQYLIIDHVVCAWCADVQHEADIFAAAKSLAPAIAQHASLVDPSLQFKDLKDKTLGENLELLRTAAIAGIKLAQVATKPGLKNALSALNSYS